MEDTDTRRRRLDRAIRSLDIFGEPVGVNFKGKDTYNTKVGSLFSLAVFTVVCVYSL